MRRQMLVTLLFLLVSLTGCTVSQSQGLDPFQAEDEELNRARMTAGYRQPRLGMPYPTGIGGLGAVGIVGGIGGVGGVGGICP